MRFFGFGLMFACLSISGIGFPGPCHIQVNPSKPQYIIGYGSLMSESSKHDTYHSVGENSPILLNGYQRGWFARGLYHWHATTFLGAIDQPNQNMNAVIFKVSPSVVGVFDKRERNYCRNQVNFADIKWLSHKLDVTNAQIWIYKPNHSIRLKPSKAYPIYQTYIDIFLQGCVELEKKFHLKEFSKNCVIKTTEWSKNIKNDRNDNARYQTEINQLLRELK